MYGPDYLPPNMDNWSEARVFRLLEKNGISQAIVEFSGGHDEGGEDKITVTIPKGVAYHAHLHWPTLKEVTAPPKEFGDAELPWVNHPEDVEVYTEDSTEVCIKMWYPEYRWSGEGSDRVYEPVEPKETKGMVDEGTIACALCIPMYREYGSFAGEFSVYGQYIFDVTGDHSGIPRTVWRNYTEEVASGTARREQFNWKDQHSMDFVKAIFISPPNNG